MLVELLFRRRVGEENDGLFNIYSLLARTTEQLLVELWLLNNHFSAHGLITTTLVQYS